MWEDKESKKINYKKGAKVKALRDNSCYALACDSQKLELEENGNIRNFYGTIIRVNRKFRCYVSFDDMQAEHKKLHVKLRNTLSVLDPDEEEQEHDHVVEECEKIGEKECIIQLKLQREFSNLSYNEMCSAKNSFMNCNGDKY